MLRSEFGKLNISSGIKVILITTGLSFLFQQFSPYYTYWGQLKPSLVLSGQVWRLISYGFLHGGVWHILWNMLALWMFGGEIEERWGEKRFLLFYFISVLGSGLFSLPMLFMGDPGIIGASGAVLALLTVYAWYYPDRQILIFFVFPVPVRIAVILFGAVSVFGMSNSGSPISHITHLGGIVVAIIYLKLYNRVEAEITHYRAVSAEKKMRENAERIFAEKKQYENEIDPILKKISEEGMDSLSKNEKEILDKASKKKRR